MTTPPLKTFKIGIWEEVGGYVEIKAETEEAAKAIVQEKLDDHGVSAFPDFDTTHRDCNIVDCEEA